MTAIHIDTTPAFQVGDQVQGQRKSGTTPGRISSIHRRKDGVEYVVSLTAPDGGLGSVLNVWTTSGQSSFLRPAPTGGASR